ncbi:MAG TPA: hypothetical protein VK177_14665 [Flavobacteriales bacterium]|nr:hypothetical protein [Flavobacteriales bacterium]
MGLFDGIKRRMAQSGFKREFKNYVRAGKVYNMDEARSVTILYYLDNEETFSIIKKYVKYLKEEEGIKRVMAIGYYDGDEKNVPEYISPKLEFDFIVKHVHAKSGKPAGNIVKNFIEQDYDILLDLTYDKKLPLMYMLNWSAARFKVGVHQEENLKFYDLNIIQHNKSLTDLIDNINSILKKINKPHVA